MDFLPFSSFGLCTQISSNFIHLVLVSCLADWSIRVFCHLPFAICLSSFSSLWSYLRASLCSREDCTPFFSCALWILIWTFQFVQFSTRRSHPLKVLLFFAAIKLLFQSNSIPLRIHLPFCPLIFRYSAWSSIVLNTRWSYSQSFASNCNGCLVSLPVW